jgi:GDPmannose 4,6-dehydratase
MTPTSLVTGITGQDGFYLASALAVAGVRVIGSTRELGGAATRLGELSAKVELVEWDLESSDRFVEILREHAPQQIYNLAAFTSGEFMDRESERVTNVNGVAVLRMLEGIRATDPTIRFCQASSSEVFAASGVSPQDEETPRVPRSIYGAAKVFGDTAVRLYREKYGLFACSAFLFNHESPRRDEGFVTQKVVRAAVRIKLNRQSKLLLGNLAAARDWGFAGDFTKAMQLMLASDTPRDYVIATGQTHTVRELCESAFGTLGLDYREYVEVDARHYRADEPAPMVGDARRARSELNWSPRVSFSEMIAMMIDHAMAQEQSK